MTDPCPEFFVKIANWIICLKGKQHPHYGDDCVEVLIPNCGKVFLMSVDRSFKANPQIFYRFNFVTDKDMIRSIHCYNLDGLKQIFDQILPNALTSKLFRILFVQEEF